MVFICLSLLGGGGLIPHHNSLANFENNIGLEFLFTKNPLCRMPDSVIMIDFSNSPCSYTLLVSNGLAGKSPEYVELCLQILIWWSKTTFSVRCPPKSTSVSFPI